MDEFTGHFLGIQENTSDRWFTTREHGMTMLYHAIENTVASTINGTYTWRTMGRLGVIPSNKQKPSCILTGCFFLWHDIKNYIRWMHQFYDFVNDACSHLFLFTFDFFRRKQQQAWDPVSGRVRNRGQCRLSENICGKHQTREPGRRKTVSWRYDISGMNNLFQFTYYMKSIYFPSMYFD